LVGEFFVQKVIIFSHFFQSSLLSYNITFSSELSEEYVMLFSNSI
jgi:hypothetical protein